VLGFGYPRVHIEDVIRETVTNNFPCCFAVDIDRCTRIEAITTDALSHVVTIPLYELNVPQDLILIVSGNNKQQQADHLP
jgi:hypothetical protein